MTKILVLWEDKYHDGLQICLKRALRQMDPPHPPHLFAESVHGNGGFERYIQEDWPMAARKGMAKSHGPIHHLLCVADADRADDCCGAGKPPEAPLSTADWVARANQLWTSRLREMTKIEPAAIHGRFLRWNCESLLIAGHDMEQALVCLGGSDLTAIRRHFEGKGDKNPLGTADDRFVDLYRHSARCLDDLLRAGGCEVPPKKASLARADALREISQEIGRLCARIPDLKALAELLLSLRSGVADERVE